MRHLMTLVTVLATSSSAALAGPQETAILKVHEDFATAWNKHDHKALASHFADDADLINPLGRRARGKAEIAKLYQDEHTGAFKSSRFAADCKAGVRIVTSEVAVVTCSFEVTGGVLPDGKAMPPLKGIYTATMLKAKDTWQVVAGRPMIPFAPPS
jgi:uncharacterized protein (TIGR02246 family)